MRALRDYLAVRGMGPTDHVFLYRNLPVHKDLIHSRIRAAAERGPGSRSRRIVCAIPVPRSF